MRHVYFIFDKNKGENEHEKKGHLSISNEDYYMALWHEVEKRYDITIYKKINSKVMIKRKTRRIKM
jgi:hypothetical protein